MSDLKAELRRISYLMEEETVPVVPLQDYPNLRLDGMHFNLMKDQETELPLWIAEVLASKEIILIKSEDIVSHRALQAKAVKESENRSLVELDSLLYRRVRTEIERLTNESTKISMRRLTSIEGSFNKLLRLRYQKILRMVTLEDQLHSNQVLTEEEKWLVDQLSDIYSSWSDVVGLESTEDDF